MRRRRRRRRRANGLIGRRLHAAAAAVEAVKAVAIAGAAALTPINPINQRLRRHVHQQSPRNARRFAAQRSISEESIRQFLFISANFLLAAHFLQPAWAGQSAQFLKSKIFY